MGGHDAVATERREVDAVVEQLAADDPRAPRAGAERQREAPMDERPSIAGQVGGGSTGPGRVTGDVRGQLRGRLRRARGCLRGWRRRQSGDAIAASGAAPEGSAGDVPVAAGPAAACLAEMVPMRCGSAALPMAPRPRPARAMAPKVATRRKRDARNGGVNDGVWARAMCTTAGGRLASSGRCALRGPSRGLQKNTCINSVLCGTFPL